MARARNIKPSFFTNELLGTYDPIIQLMFAGLWCLADKEGVLEDRPLRIKAELFPYREGLDINGYLTVLERDGFVVRYVVDGVGYILITNFEKHQHPHHTEKPKNFPKPQAKQQEQSLTPLNNRVTPSDSLIPDSLIPDLLIPPSEGADAPEKQLFGRGLQILKTRGVEEKNARAFIGLMRKKAGDIKALTLLLMIDEQDISSPIPWLTKVMDNKERNHEYKSQRDKVAETGSALTGRAGHARVIEGTATPVG